MVLLRLNSVVSLGDQMTKGFFHEDLCWDRKDSIIAKLGVSLFSSPLRHGFSLLRSFGESRVEGENEKSRRAAHVGERFRDGPGIVPFGVKPTEIK